MQTLNIKIKNIQIQKKLVHDFYRINLNNILNNNINNTINNTNFYPIKQTTLNI